MEKTKKGKERETHGQREMRKKTRNIINRKKGKKVRTLKQK